MVTKDRMVWLQCPNCQRSLGFSSADGSIKKHYSNGWCNKSACTCGFCKAEIKARTYMLEIEKDF